MSTRSCIAEPVGDGWKGVYAHWDGYPACQGPRIWEDLTGRFQGNVPEFLKQQVHGHPGGWSQFPKTCYCHDPQREREPPMIITSEDGDESALWIEWVYVLGPRALTIFKSVPLERRAAYDYRYGWQVVCSLPYDATPDWEAVQEQGEALSREAHRALDVSDLD